MFDRFDLRYVLPNTVTAASLVMAMVAIVLASRGEHASAAWLIVWCALLDRLDGVVARWLDACSEFGVHFDTLADLLAFCVAPALLVYFVLQDDPRYAPVFTPYPARAVLLASVGIYCLFGALRLARFNIQTRSIGPKWSRGLPVTMAAGLVSTFILTAWERSLPQVVAASPIVLWVCAAFMISHLWLPKSLGKGSRVPFVLQALGATAIYGLGFSRAHPTILLAAALVYPGLGFVYGGLRPPTSSRASGAH